MIGADMREPSLPVTSEMQIHFAFHVLNADVEKNSWLVWFLSMLTRLLSTT